MNILNINRDNPEQYYASGETPDGMGGRFVRTIEQAIDKLKKVRTNQTHVYLWTMNDGTPSVIVVAHKYKSGDRPYIGKFEPPELWEILETYARML